MYITKEQIWQQTDGGLAVIFELFPQAKGCEDQKKKFAIRDEKTASAKLKRQPDGVWVLTDFGSDGKGKNAITLVMEEKAMDFVEACQWISARLSLQGEDGKSAKQFEMESRPARAGEHDGHMTFSRREHFTVAELRVMFAECLLTWLETANRKAPSPSDDPLVIYRRAHELLERYGWSALDSYALTAKGNTYTYFSNAEYPIFLMEDPGGFAKLYKPKEREKKYRFMYHGKLPKDHVWGMRQAEAAYQKLLKEHDDGKEQPQGDEIKPSDNAPKLEHIIVASGERDSMNVALMGYLPVWQNSETKEISGDLFSRLKRMATHPCILPDIDATGMEMGIKAALKHIDLETIRLPSWLLSRRDWRGNLCKDLRDFLAQPGIRKKDFDGLVRTARRCRFWDIVTKKDKNGNAWKEWDINPALLHHFLFCHGFRRETGTENLFKIEGHLLRRFTFSDIRAFVYNYLTDIYADIGLLNRFTRSSALNESSLDFFTRATPVAHTYGPDFQFLCFQNQAWRISAEKIEAIGYHAAHRSGLRAWDNLIVKRRAELKPAPFSWTTTEDGHIEVAAPNPECLYLQYLIAGSRMYWREEEKATDLLPTAERAEYWNTYRHALDGDGPERYLSPEQCSEQRRHLANKLYVIGYMLHKYKSVSRPWAPWIMDARLSADGQSWGRSGKSLMLKALREIVPTKTIGARNVDIIKNTHIYDGVTRETGMILVDDCAEFLRLDFFFTSLTDSLQVNAKHIREEEILYEDFGKFAFSSNFSLKNMDPSSLSRLIFVVFSDFFHEKTDETDYKETRKPIDWLGREICRGGFTDSDWDNFFNTCAHALRFYLSCPDKLSPPMGQVSLRSHMSTMGDQFFNWAMAFFSPESGNLDTILFKGDLLKIYEKQVSKKGLSTHSFTKKIKAFVAYHNERGLRYILNPSVLLNSQGRLIRKHPEEKTASEAIYIQTKEDITGTADFASSAFEDVPPI